MASSIKGLAELDSPLLSGGVAGKTLPVTPQVLTQGLSFELMLEQLILAIVREVAAAIVGLLAWDG